MASNSARGEGFRGDIQGTETVPEALAGLWERARPNMVERLKTLERALGELERGQLSEKARMIAVREAHKLAGSLGTYGLMSGSKVAREIELRLEKEGEDEGKGTRRSPPDPEWLRSRVRMIGSLLRQHSAGGGQNDSSASPVVRSAPAARSRSREGRTGISRPRAESTRPTQRQKSNSIHVDWDESVSANSDRTDVFPFPTAGLSTHGQEEQVARTIDRPALARLLRRCRQELEDVESVVASSIRQAGRHVDDPQTLQKRLDAALQLETVAGWLQEVGIDLPTRRARGLAKQLRGRMDNVEVTRVAEEILTVQRLLGRLEQPQEASGSQSRVLVVSTDRVWAQKTRTALEVLGHRVVFAGPGGKTGRAGPAGLAGVVVDGGPGALEGLRSLAGLGVSTPVVYAVEAPDTRKRVEAGRLGADRVVDRAVPARELCGALSDLLVVSRGTTGRVLLVDDDETVLQAVEATLRHAGYEVTAVQGPERFWEALEESAPELVITDLDMPGMDGAELTLAMRTDARWVNLPVVFLSSKDDHASLRRVFEAGADDFVPKPLRPELLLARVSARMARVKARSATGHLDPVTRLPVGAAFEHTLDDLVHSAGQTRRTLTVAVLRLDAASHLRDRLGMVGLEREEARLARVLSGQVDPPAVVGRRETDRFVLVLPETDLQEASALLGRIVDPFHKESEPRGGRPQVTVSAGIAQCGVHGRRTVELVAAAETARARAEEAGGSKVFLAGEDGAARRVEQVDVLVVDDDPTIGELLLETLAHKGWDVAWEPESERAVKRLAGPERDLRARVILLDVNMPGMDGLTVLRLLRENHVVPPTRVVMLTVRAREDEVVRALNMGARDHVAKPFSVPVLMTRVQRALGDTR